MSRPYPVLMIATTVAVLTIGAAVLGVTTRDGDEGLFVVQTVALTVAVAPALVVGRLLMLWSWRGGLARRHRRRLVAASAFASALGGAVLLWSAAATGAIAVAGVAVLSLSATPLAGVLGRGARRAEDREDRPGSDEQADTEGIGRTVRRARRRASIGAAVGLAVGLLVAGLTMFDSRPAGTVLGVAFTAFSAILGATTVRLVAGAVLTRSARSALGTDWSRAHRIGRAIAGEAELNDADADQAERYARVAATAVPFTQNTAAILHVGMVLLLLGVAVGGEDVTPFRGVVVALSGLSAVLATARIAVRNRQVRRLHAFLDSRRDDRKSPRVTP